MQEKRTGLVFFSDRSLNASSVQSAVTPGQNDNMQQDQLLE